MEEKMEGIGKVISDIANRWAGKFNAYILASPSAAHQIIFYINILNASLRLLSLMTLLSTVLYVKETIAGVVSLPSPIPEIAHLAVAVFIGKIVWDVTSLLFLFLKGSPTCAGCKACTIVAYLAKTSESWGSDMYNKISSEECTYCTDCQSLLVGERAKKYLTRIDIVPSTRYVPVPSYGTINHIGRHAIN